MDSKPEVGEIVQYKPRNDDPPHRWRIGFGWRGACAAVKQARFRVPGNR